MKTNLLLEMFLAVAFFFLGGVVMAAAAFADDRIDRISLAWNAQDQGRTQADFSKAAPREAAELGSKVRGNLAILKSANVSPGVYAVMAEANGVQEVWLFAECPDNPRLFCHFSHKPHSEISTIGGMEYGQLADIGTTAIGLGMGLSEGNPFGLVGAGLIKGIFLVGNRITDFQSCVDQRAGYDMIGFGAGASNVLTMMGAPFAFGVGAMVLTAYARHDAAREGAVWECAAFKLEA